MQTTSDFYDELIRGLNLPNYFGKNLNALDECLCDLEWLHGIGFILLIRNGQNVLRLETPEKLEGFLDILKTAGNEWSLPVADKAIWDRPSRPFHTIFQCDDYNWRDEIPIVQKIELDTPTKARGVQ